jgi:GTPase-associated adaptor domain
MPDSDPRQLTYRYLGLPPVQRRTIASALGLVSDAEQWSSEQSSWATLFQRAKDRGIVPQLQKAVDEAYTQLELPPDPPPPDAPPS